MADLAGDFQLLAASARRFVGLLSKRESFARVTTREKRERGAALVNHVDYTAKGIDKQISEVEDEFARAKDRADREEAIKRVRLLAAYAHFMRRALPWLEDASNPPLELGALYFIDQMARALIKVPVDVVPTLAGEYSTEQRPFERLFPELKLRAETGPRPIILNLPALEAHSFPLLPLFGHELSHTAVQTSDLKLSALTTARGNSEFNSAVSQSISALAQQASIREKRAQLIVDERLEDWTEELLCDQLALQYVGPSFLLALAAYLAPLSWNSPGPRHPPTTVRIAHLLAWIEGTPWEKLLRERMPVVFDWLREAAATPRPAGLKPSIEALLDATDVARETISDTASHHLAGHIYNANAYLGKARHLDELLRYEVLPVQDPSTGYAFEGRAILMAGWFSIHEEVKGSTCAETPSALSLTLSQEISNAFFTKALEMSRVLAVWGDID